MALLVSNVRWPGEGKDPSQALASRLGVSSEEILRFLLVKKSLDARHKKQLWFAVYRVEVVDEEAVLSKEPPAVRRWTGRDTGRYGLDAQAPVQHTGWSEEHRIIVVGAGPAGLFAALYLAEAGARVLILERGEAVGPRVKAVNRYWRDTAPLDPENNLVFGEGGAGTFSDGKIYTRRRDGELGFIFRRLVSFGAKKDILHEAWAHLGTDRVRKILPKFRERLEELGVEYRFKSRVVNLLVENGRCAGVRLADGREELGEATIVAAGHSARDTAEMLIQCGAEASPRGIAVGARIEHPQEMVDIGRYGKSDRGELPPASYRFTYGKSGGRDVHTFCMCPGGLVVPASNHQGRVVVNGMSFSTRRARWANSAVIVAVKPEEFGATDAMAGFRWQDKIERACFDAAGGRDHAPAQRVDDFISDRLSQSIESCSYPRGVASTMLKDMFPGSIGDSMKAAILAWEQQIPGFSGASGVLIAPETRTTSPVKFHRQENGCSTSIRALYPIGEGAGYGGGIISCALDGLRVARNITEACRPAVQRKEIL